ncbi:MAG: hypothetical protein M3Z02_09290 [Actinomycetota bacterium]|nr:hypothetical protein [Actinomycetota bacterium]
MLSLPLLIIAAVVALLLVVLVVVLVSRVRSGNEVDRFHRARTMTTAWSESGWQRRAGARGAAPDGSAGADSGPVGPRNPPAQETRGAAPQARTE